MLRDLIRDGRDHARFWAKVDKTDGCWNWTAATTRGHGVFALRHNRLVYAHRFAYEILVGPVPDGLELDHLCRNRGCVNPDHLEAVTHGVNVRRGRAGINNLIKTHCARGHEFTPENTSPHNGVAYWRRCRICSRESNRRYKLRMRSERAA